MTGFEDMVNVRREAKNPRRRVPRAVVLARVTIVMLLFELVEILGAQDRRAAG